MAPPTDAEKAALQQDILAQLAPTPHACSALEELTNGTTNFVFRGRLVQPRQDGSRTVIVKHATDYAAANKDFPLDISRSIFEETMLHALNAFPEDGNSLTTSSAFSAKAPRLFWFDRATNTQVLEDFPDAVDLKASLLASAQPDSRHPLVKTSGPVLARSIGQAMGSWLRAFYAWASAPAQAALRRAIAANEPMRQLKKQITYGVLVRVLAQFPAALGDQQGIIEAVQAMAAAEFATAPSDEDEAEADDGWGIIHGDLWSGNILLPTESHLQGTEADAAASTAPHALFVVDWEFAQHGPRAYDLGQLVGDLIERHHFRRGPAALDILDGFVEGYDFAALSAADDNRLAFRTAIHAGVQLIGCFTRRAPTGPLPGTPEQVEQAMRLGADLVVKGWARDRAWFQSSMLAKLFV